MENEMKKKKRSGRLKITHLHLCKPFHEKDCGSVNHRIKT